MMMSDADIPVFNVDLGQQLEPGLLAVGWLDGSPSFAVVSQRHVLVHAPVSKDDGVRPETRTLNIQREVTDLCVGRFSRQHRKKIPGISSTWDSKESPEVLFIASPESVKATDIYSNADIYVADCSDEGALCVTFGTYECYPDMTDIQDAAASGSPSTSRLHPSRSASDSKTIGVVHRGVTVVGGRASVRVLDADGAELMWAAAPAEVVSVGLTPFRPPRGSEFATTAAAISATGVGSPGGKKGGGKDGRSERNAIVAGCGDGSLVWYRGSYAYATVNVGGPISCIRTVAQGERGMRSVDGVGDLVAYRTLQGMVGVANAGGILWSRPTAGTGDSVGGLLLVKDLDSNGEAEVVVEGPRGLIGLAVRTGDQRWQVCTGGRAPVAVGAGNIGGRATDQLVVAFADGAVCGYEIASPDDGAVGAHSYDIQRAEAELATILSAHASLSQQTERLAALVDQKAKSPSRVPVDVAVVVRVDERTSSLVVLATVHNGYVHQMILKGGKIGGEGVDTIAVVNRQPVASGQLSAAISPTRDADRTFTARVFVTADASSPETLQAVDISAELPPFPALTIKPYDEVKKPQGSVTFRFQDRPKRVVLWLQKAFPPPPPTAPLQVTPEGELHVAFEDATTSSTMTLDMVRDSVTIGCDSIELAGRAIKEFTSFFNISSLASTCSFPKDFEALREACDSVAELNSTRLRLTAQAASEAQNVKVLIVLAEDSRINCDALGVRKNLVALSNLNQDLIFDHKKRAANHAELLSCLKKMNSYVTLGAALRVGAPAHDMVQACRAAIKDNRTGVLAQIISAGRET